MARRKSVRRRSKPTEEQLQGPPPREATILRRDSERKAEDERGEIDPTAIVTHRAPPDDAPRLYDGFDAKRDGCVKVVLAP